MPTVEVPGTVTASQKKQIKAWWKKVTVNNPNGLQFRQVKMPIVERGVFGIPLIESVNYARTRISFNDEVTGKACNGFIPIIIAKCGAFLKDEALSTEGIFRLSGNVKRISMLQTIFDTPNGYGSQLDWRGYTVHDASNVMRRFLNYLPEPIITLKYQSAFKNALDAVYPSLEVKIHAFQDLIEQLPTPNQYILIYLLDMLCLFSTCSDNTKMDLSSLATVFAPAILSDPNDPMNPTRYKEAQRVLEFLIKHQDKFSLPGSSSLKPNTDPLTHQQDNSRLQQELRRHNSKKSRTADNDLKITRPYSLLYGGSHSVSDLTSDPIEPKSILKRSKTAPTRRSKFGEYEPEQVVFVNNNYTGTSLNHSNWSVGRWKSIKIINKDEGKKI
ncbi:Rho GTPase activation protein [Pilaira anomala]|nr:Rho GTPase activation protein [Pilaira anomala]